MPKVYRPESWNGFLVIDVPEAARRLGRSEKAVRRLIDKKRLRRVPTDDRRVLVYASEVNAVAQSQPHVQLRLVGVK